MSSSKSKTERVLVVDDAPDTLEVIQRNLTTAGYRVFVANGVEEAIRVLETVTVDLVVTDLKMPKVSGMDLVRHVRENFRQTEVMMITGYASVESAVEAVKAGAEEYLAKPFSDKELLSAVARSLAKRRLRELAEDRPDTPAPHGFIGNSKPMRQVYAAISKAASSSATILISGESGTGKELVARAVHYSNVRAAAPFVPVNCAGIPEGLLESALFGHAKGAFTGATESRAGFFQTADGGTVFLDEIGDTGMPMQSKLLRVLQDKEVCMVGSSKTRKVDVRVIAATNKDLLVLTKKGLFREDLFFRINVVSIVIPPLRERGEDVLLLAQHFASKFAGESGKAALRFSDDALRVLTSYHWPGNVREVENVIHRLVVMTNGDVIEVPDLPSLVRFSALRGKGANRTLADVEAEHIRNVLAEVGGNKSRAAEILGIDRKTLRRKSKNSQTKPD